MCGRGGIYGADTPGVDSQRVRVGAGPRRPACIVRSTQRGEGCKRALSAEHEIHV